MAYAILAGGLTPDVRAAVEAGWAAPTLAAVPAPRRFGEGWGEGPDAQAGQDAALGLAGIRIEDIA